MSDLRDRLADRINALLEEKGTRLSGLGITSESFYFLKGGARKAALDYGCQRWSASGTLEGSGTYVRVHSLDSLRACSRRLRRLVLDRSGYNEWELSITGLTEDAG